MFVKSFMKLHGFRATFGRCGHPLARLVAALALVLLGACAAETGGDALLDPTMSDDAGSIAGHDAEDATSSRTMDTTAADGTTAGDAWLPSPWSMDVVGPNAADTASALDVPVLGGGGKADTSSGADDDTDDDDTDDTDDTDDDDTDDGKPDASTDDAGTDDDGTDDDATATACAAKPGAPEVEPPALPGADTCVWKDPIFFMGPPPAPTLDVSLGVAASKTTPWTALVDQDFLGMFHGMQGSFHSFAAFRVALKDTTAPLVKLQVEAWLSASCGIIALGKQPVVFAKPVAGQPGVYGNAEAGEGGVLLYFGLPGYQSVKFCNTWARLHVRVRRHGTQSWGSASKLVRLYDND